ncbi:hypothetical protein AB4262_06005 [Vibrio breoganii]
MVKEKILFSESEVFYRSLGLTELENVSFEFDGMKKYKESNKSLSEYNMFVCAFYSLPHNYILTEKFNGIGVKTVIVSDGIFDFANSFRNKIHVQYGLKLYFPIVQDYFIIADLISGEYHMNDKAVKLLNYRPSRMIETIEKIPLPQSKKILITTANQAYFSLAEFHRLKSLLIEISLFLKENDIDFAFRIFDKELINELGNFFGDNLVNDVEDNFEVCLVKYSSVITTPSSICVTSMYHNRPVLNVVLRADPVIIQAIWNIQSFDMFVGAFNDFYNFSIESQEEQDILLNSYISKYSLSEVINEVRNDELSIKKKQYADTLLMKMLNSKFNFNIEYFIRKIYNRYKKQNLIKQLRQKVKW